MIALYLILLVASVACFIVATVSSTVSRVNLMALGLALFAAVPTIQLINRLAQG